MLVFRGFFSLSYNPVLQGSEGVYLREMSGICRHSAPPRTFQVIPLLTYFTILSALRGIGLKFLRVDGRAQRSSEYRLGWGKKWI